MTQTERELQRLSERIVIHEERISDARDDDDDLSKALEKQRDSIDNVRDDIANLRSLVAVQTALLDDLKKRWEESDRRRWTIYGVMLAAAFTFMANLLLLLLRK